MGQLTGFDWGIVVAYLLLALGAGVLLSRLAGRSLESYFIAGRQLPWWWLGTSMVATTFAADTPLAVTGLIANDGIAGNWFWWNWAFGFVAIAVVFAALWRRARVLTDAEIVELRYSGPSASMLRGFKAVFFAIVINGIVLGWVIRAMSKISTPFVHWDQWLGPDRFAALEAAWPGWLIFGTMNDTLTVVALFGLITLYSTLGGIRGVILTDLFQFAIAIVSSIAFAVIAVRAVGGMGELVAQLHAIYPDADRIIAFTPRLGEAAWLPVQVFLIYLAVQWWAQYWSDGSGYIAQRLNTAKSDEHATAGAIWFAIAHFGLRTWPWVLIGVTALVLYPLGAEPDTAVGQMIAEDREMAYPVLMAQLLPVGLLGLLFASLLAAFMSTVDTHLNWGASYLINDVYRRFVRPQASMRELVAVSRATVVGLAVLAILIASQIATIEGAWKFFVALGAGLGLPSMLRWVWWRANAWTEISGMVVAVVAAFTLYGIYGDTVRDEYLLVVIVALATTASLVATFVTAPVPGDQLRRFVERVRPPGFWAEYGGERARRGLREVVVAWVAGTAAVFGLMFGAGHLIFGRPALGTALLAAGATGVYYTLVATRRVRTVLVDPADPAARLTEAEPAD